MSSRCRRSKLFMVFVCYRLPADGAARTSSDAASLRMRLASGLSPLLSDVIYDVKWSSRLDHVLAHRSLHIPDVTYVISSL